MKSIFEPRMAVLYHMTSAVPETQSTLCAVNFTPQIVTMVNQHMEHMV